MRIAFLTACLEPGKDGVGDYSRDLAAACVERGHSCRLVALNDRNVDCGSIEVQAARGQALESLRLPQSTSWASRIGNAREWLAQWRPDWISLQFVPYGYSPKGLVGDLGSQLAALLPVGSRMHVMFHELWVGLARDASYRHRLMGWLQRRAVMDMVARLSPTLVHASNQAYVAVLARMGVQAKLLPLYGNIPIASPPDPAWLAGELRALGVPSQALDPRDACLWFGLFGSLHPVWPPEPLLSRIVEAGTRSSRRVVVASIGRQGPGESLWRDLAGRYGSSIAFANLGERSQAEVSAFLQSIDFGIATTPWQLIGKSGTVAAMLEHGVPVIVNRDDVHFDVDASPEPSPLLYRMDEGLASWLAQPPPRMPPAPRLASMAALFIADLERAGTGRFHAA